MKKVLREDIYDGGTRQYVQSGFLVKNGEIRLVYLMNDAVESFLVFGNARMTGVYKPDYKGEILADLSRQGREYILVVHQDESVVTLFFETLVSGKTSLRLQPDRSFPGRRI